MKTFLIALLLALVSDALYCQSKANDLVASCCDGGRCTGSAYCSACKNCSRCAHCNSGGSCGVCSGGSRKSSYSTPKRKSSSSYTSSGNYSSFYNYTKGDALIVTNETLNLREGPGTDYKILERLTRKSSLILVEDFGKWLKVRVQKTGTIGYVYYKYVKKE